MIPAARGVAVVLCFATGLVSGCRGIVSGPPAGPRDAGPLVDVLLADTVAPAHDLFADSAADADRAVEASAQPPFSCSLPAVNPSLHPRHWIHPQSPRAGQTLAIKLRTTGVGENDAPKLTIDHVSRRGIRTITHADAQYEIDGGDFALYYMSVANLAGGENCVIVRNGSSVELAHKVVAASVGAGLPRGNGVWKVTRNHQWTCQEQPEWGNLLHVVVRDENGAPVSGAKVLIRWTEDLAYPIAPDTNAMSWESHKQPKQMVTDEAGKAELMTPWGEGIRSPWDAENSYVVFLLYIDGGASDVATEITTGLWGIANWGCTYCGGTKNVYGHWSHTVEFKRDPAATEVCEVPTDHVGQSACPCFKGAAPGTFCHFYHDPKVPSCAPVAP